MNEQHDPDTLSIQIKLTDKSVLVRNMLIGGALCMALTPIITSSGGIYSAIATLVSGVVSGAFTAFVAWLGQIIARNNEGQTINRRAVWYTGLIVAWLGIGFLGVLSPDGMDFGTRAVLVIIAMIFGAMAGVAVSMPGAIIREAMRGKESAPQMLHEGQFDSLQQPQRLRDEARR
jgi:hypothetical protein